MTKEKGDASIFSRATLIPVGLVGAILLGVVGIVAHFFGHEKEHAIRLLQIEQQIEMLRRDMQDKMGSRWTKHDMERLWAIFCADNRELTCREVD